MYNLRHKQKKRGLHSFTLQGVDCFTILAGVLRRYIPMTISAQQESYFAAAGEMPYFVVSHLFLSLEIAEWFAKTAFTAASISL
jgi:thiamine biosynthesis protein ThiC